MTNPFTVAEEDIHELVQSIEAWFEKHFSHVEAGTPEHATLTAAKEDLKATLTGTVPLEPAPAPIPAPAPEPAPAPAE